MVFHYARTLKILTAFAFFFIFALPHPGICADLFVRKPGTEKPKPPPEASPPAQQTAPVGDPAPASENEPPGISEFASRYYKSCMAKPEPLLKTAANLQMLCGCASEKLLQEMSQDDVNAMASTGAEGEFQRNRLLLQVYAPCMQYPVREILVAKCIADPDVQKSIPLYQAVCACMGDRMAAHVNQNGSSIIAKSLRTDPQNLTPISNLIKDPEFQAKAQTELANCMKTVSDVTNPPVQ